MGTIVSFLHKCWKGALGWFWREFKREVSNWWQFIQDRTALVIALLLVLVLFNFVGNLTEWWDHRDNDPERGAAVVARDAMGDRSTRIVYLDQGDAGQGWSPSDTLWFDNIAIGSDLIPYDFFLALRSPNGKPLRDNENLNSRYRFLVRKPTLSNPDGLPVGLVKDEFKGRAFVGFTCAACHTGQINYRGTGMRIDGAPAMADVDTFLTDLGTAFRLTQTKGHAHDAFVRDVIALGHYDSDADVEKDLDIYALRLTAYRDINKSFTRYGFGRLDAVGRIYNQVLEYISNVRDVEMTLTELVQEGRITEADIDRSGLRRLLGALEVKQVLDGADRDRLLQTLVTGLSLKQVLFFRSKIFNAPDAPASYPALWDTRQYDVSQWNGSSSNENYGATDRDIAETLGLFATLNWSLGDHWTLAGATSGQALSSRPSKFESSVRVENLKKIESQLKWLHSPRWPQQLLGNLDSSKIARGANIFNRYCVTCHETIYRTASDRAGQAYKMPLDQIQTDSQLAMLNATDHGLSGILADQYVRVGTDRVWLGRSAPVSALSGQVAVRIFAEPDPDAWWPTRLFWKAPGYLSKHLGMALGMSDEEPDNVGAFKPDLFYKARSLNGIWATAPYLHNGSVPTLYDLLLPAEARPTQFTLGSREFDPVHVGFMPTRMQGATADDPCPIKHPPEAVPCFVFRTVMLGNSNGGHEYGMRDVFATNPDGTDIVNPDGTKTVVLKALSEEQRWDLVEYLKNL